MHEHGPNCLAGPVRGSSAWWRGLAAVEPASQPASPAGTDDAGLAKTEIRHELVSRVRREIAAGTYDSPEKWQQALDRMLERMDG